MDVPGINRIATSNTGPSAGEVTHEGDGRLTADGNKGYQWEAQGWLCGVTLPGNTFYQYIYDPEGHIITTATPAAEAADDAMKHGNCFRQFLRR